MKQVETYGFKNWRESCARKMCEINERRGYGPIDVYKIAGLRAFLVDLYEDCVSVEEASQLAWKEFC